MRTALPLDPRDTAGSTLIITLLVMFMIFALGSALTTGMLTEITSSANYRTRGAALWQAEAGLEGSAVALLADSGWAQQMVDFSTLPMALSPIMPMSATFFGDTVTFADDGSGQPIPQFYDLGGTVALDAGSFQRQVFMPPIAISSVNGSGTKAWLIVPVGATGNSGGVEASTAQLSSDMRVTVRRLTVWDNALFGGAGQGGNAINGNVQIRGSVHVIGSPGDVINSNGTAWVINNYSNAAGSFGAAAGKLPSLTPQMFNGELVQTLDSEVRVKQGTINLGGNVKWGQADASGNAYKETLDGFYNDATLNTSGSAAVNADEYDGYDAGAMSFPSLDDPYYDASTSTLYATHRTYLNNVALTIPVTEISVDTASFSLADANGNSIDWNAGTGTMTISGIVRVAGDLEIAKKNNPVSYDGTGTLYATGNVYIRSDLLPVGGYLNLASPIPDNLGIIADTDLHLANGPGESQINVMAALYGESAAYLNKQTDVAGAIVSQAFDLGNQVPSVWQVPTLSTNLPPGMPGADPVLFVTGAELTNWYHHRQ